MKLTPWFPGHIKPERVGVYQQMCGRQLDLGYQRWDGFQWYGWSSTVQGAVAARDPADSCTQSDPWRGLARRPKA